MEAASLWAGVRFTARNGSPEALLTDAAGQGLHLYGISSLPGGFCGHCAAWQYQRLATLARHRRVRLRVEKRKGLYFLLRPLLRPTALAPFPAMLLEVCSGCDYAARTGLWASGLCCAALSVQGASVLLQVRTLCPPEVSFKPLLWSRVLHLPLSLALFYLGLPQSAVESFNTLCARVVPMQRVPTDCALLVFAVCCITACEACRLTGKKAQNAVPANKKRSAACKPP